MVTENQLLQHVHHRIAQSDEPKLRGARTFDGTLTGNDAGDFERLRQAATRDEDLLNQMT